MFFVFSAKNLTCLRFVLLCVNSAWANLNQMGFDILSNIASEVQLEEPGEDAVTDLMIKSLSRCIGDQDRFQVCVGSRYRVPVPEFVMPCNKVGQCGGSVSENPYYFAESSSGSESC